jgi:hypothetical protein
VTPPLTVTEPTLAAVAPGADPYRPWIVRLLARHPGGLVTGVYLALTAVGVMYDVFYYARFRVDILDYAQTGDFLVAALREPLAIIYCVLPVLLVWLVARVRRWARRKSAWYDAYAARYEKKWRVGPRWFDVMNTTFVLVYALLFVIEYATFDARRTRRADARQVRVRLLSDAGTPLQANGRTATLIGSTSAYLFLYDRAADSTYVVPASNVAQVALSSARPSSRTGAAASLTPPGPTR